MITIYEIFIKRPRSYIKTVVRARSYVNDTENQDSFRVRAPGNYNKGKNAVTMHPSIGLYHLYLIYIIAFILFISKPVLIVNL